jgi:ferredoxin
MRADGMKIRVDLGLCVGHGRCYMMAPDIFDEDDRGHCRLRLEDIPPELEEQARLGEANCPEGAIEIAEDRR